ncbi:hypothetical protein C0Q70_18929 [Pomacea canaliculata]|uniref:G-protein coupled receptors family 1 profile domain-containing protein n=1 Tax=Pomacea canaliculata TaxID=400727 RepID=A0A2T7NHZ9_POMCA|nr:hypothetical protein C0Q70_18929 [Pomacea canaliculata]
MRTSSALGHTHSGKPRLESFHGNSLANRSRRKYHGCLQGTSTPLDRNDHLTSSDLDDVTMPQAPHGLYVNLTSSSRPSGFFAVWAATVPMVTVSVVTLAANGTVLLMFVLRPSLRRGKNAYIASLALADFLIGCYMPLLALEEVGLVAMGRGCECRMYVTGQQALVYVSLLSILLITLDRCWSLRAPFSYRAHHTRRLAASLVSAVWTVSVVIYALPIFLWNTSRDEDNNHDDHHHSHGHDIAEECGVPYADSLGVVAVMSGLLYLLPLAAMWAVNCALYTAVRQRRSVEVRRSVSVTDTFFVTVRNCSATKAIMVNDNKPTIQITEAPSIASPPSGQSFCLFNSTAP